MSDNEELDMAGQPSASSLTDAQIVTTRNVSRRSFVTAASALAVGGTFALLSSGRARALAPSPQSDPDKKKGGDPDKKKSGDPDKKKGSDPDKKKTKKQGHPAGTYCASVEGIAAGSHALVPGRDDGGAA